jgi:putative heme iron utilization protein
MPQRLSQTALVAEYRQFLESFDTVVLATVSGEGIPEASLAPFVWGERPQLFVYLSDLAQHAQNLKQTGCVSLLFVDNEARGASPFARRRLSFQCGSELVARASPEWTTVLAAFADNFGNVVQMIEPLTDFNLYRLHPKAGHYVRGFADAYRIDGVALDRMHLRRGVDEDDADVDRS